MIPTFQQDELYSMLTQLVVQINSTVVSYMLVATPIPHNWPHPSFIPGHTHPSYLATPISHTWPHPILHTWPHSPLISGHTYMYLSYLATPHSSYPATPIPHTWPHLSLILGHTHTHSWPHPHNRPHPITPFVLIYVSSPSECHSEPPGPSQHNC